MQCLTQVGCEHKLFSDAAVAADGAPLGSLGCARSCNAWLGRVGVLVVDTIRGVIGREGRKLKAWWHIVINTFASHTRLSELLVFVNDAYSADESL